MRSRAVVLLSTAAVLVAAAPASAGSRDAQVAKRHCRHGYVLSHNKCVKKHTTRPPGFY